VYRTEIKPKTKFRVADTSNKQMEVTEFIYKIMCQISLWISDSYGFCEFNRVAIINKSKTIILLRTSIQICQLELLVSYST